MQNNAQIQSDFDRFAEFQEAPWDHNGHYHAVLLRHLPSCCEHILEIGCGKGNFSRKLAGRAAQVMALDLSPNMLRQARERSAHLHNITYVEADFVEYPAPSGAYDAIVSIATLHHLPLEQAFQKISTLLKPGGVLAVLDLYEEQGIVDALRSVLAVGVNRGLNLTKNRGYRISSEEQQMWNEHGTRETYPTIAALRKLCAGCLPGAIITKHLLWRYSLIWQKPYGS